MSSLQELVRGLGRPRVLVVGDLVLDRYVFGTVDRISPEAPIGVVNVTGEETRLGCAASVARNLSVLGAEVRLLGFLGDDRRADDFLTLSAEVGIDASGSRRVSDRATTLKTRIIARRGAGGQQVLRVDREETGPFPQDEAEALTATILESIPETDLVVLSSYAKGALSADLTSKVVEAARASSVRVLADPKPPGMERFRGVSALTPNRPESAAYVGFSPDSAEAVERAARELIEKLDLEAVVITLDRDGIYLMERGGSGEMFPVVAREVFDVTGAGDMVISVLAMVLAAGGRYRDAVRLANVAASIEVGRLGVAPVTREEILESLYEEDSVRERKGLSFGQAMEILSSRRQRNQRIVFTNGCFDVVHIGHVRLLQAARAEGDFLVVGLNSDASVRRLKGEGRPVTPERERVEVLSSLSCVDLVVVFDEDTPAEVIAKVLPDILVKGEDWRDKGVVGREFVEARGGKVVLVPLAPGVSSTGIINRIREEE